MKELKSIAKAAVGIVLGLILAKLIGLLYRILIARLSPEEYGLYSLGLVVLGIGSLIASGGLITGLVRFVSFYRGKGQESEIGKVISTSVKITIVFGVIVAILLWALSDWIATVVFKNKELVVVIKAFALVVPFYTLTEVFVSVTEAYKTIKYRVLTTHLYTNLIKLILTFIFILFGYRLMGAISAFVIATVIACWMGYRFMKRLYRQKINIRTVKFHKELYKYSWPLFLSKFLNAVYSWTDSLMIGVLMSVASVGIYNAALPVASLLQLIPSAILSLFLPTISEMHAKNEDITLIYKSVTRWIIIFSAPAAFLVITFSRKIVEMLFGLEYDAAAVPLMILSFGFFIFSVLKPSGGILNLHKRTKTVLMITFVSSIVNVVLNVVLIPKYGIIGASIATAFVNSGSYFIIFLFALRIQKTFPIDKNSFKIILITLILGGIVYLINQMITLSLINMSVMIIIFLTGYILLIKLLKCLTQHDLEVLTEFFRVKNLKREEH